jgi:hypothetical protein
VRPIRELVPVNNIRVKLRLDGKSVANHKVLRKQGEVKVKISGQNLDLNISKLNDFCAIYIQMNV